MPATREDKLFELLNEAARGDGDELATVLAPWLERLGELQPARHGSALEEIIGRRGGTGYANAAEALNTIAEVFRGARPFDLASEQSVLREAVDRTPWQSHPALLLPLRLETRLINQELLVRIYPDTIHVDGHDERLHPEEQDAVEQWKAAKRSERPDVWRWLVGHFGRHRAAYIVTLASRRGGGPLPAQPPREQDSTVSQRLNGLPHRFAVFLPEGSELVQRAVTRRVRQDATIASLTPTEIGGGLFEESSRWMVDFDAALEAGFAAKIELNAGELNRGTIERVVVVGLRDTTAREGAAIFSDLLESHRFDEGVGFIPHDLSTNNTELQSTDRRAEADADSSYDVEVVGATNLGSSSDRDRRTNAHRLADAVGFDVRVLKHLEHAGHTGDSYAAEMNMAVWPTTGHYFLTKIVGLADDKLLRHLVEHQRDFVRGGGPLPSVRVGTQPYGVLPVCRIPSQEDAPRGWARSETDGGGAVHDRRIHRVASRLFRKWLRLSSDPQRVPRIGPSDDVDADLVRVLAMEPRNVGYATRLMVEEQWSFWLLTALYKHAFGDETVFGAVPSPVAASVLAFQWTQRWRARKTRADAFVAGLVGSVVPPPGPIMRLLAWGDPELRPSPVTGEGMQLELGPSSVLKELCKRGKSDADTLFARMLTSSMRLSPAAWSEQLKNDVCALRDSTTVTLLNRTNSRGVLLERLREVGADRVSAREFAAGLLASRRRLGGFRTLDEVAAEPAVDGRLLALLAEKPVDKKDQPDFDRLFRESLDVSSHRVDAWVTSFASKRLAGMRRNGADKGVHIGAYGYVENLRPRKRPSSAGYMHAASASHAAAAAVLRNAYLTHRPEAPGKPNPFRINLTSARVRKARRILDGVRHGQPLGALLGYQFERGMRDAGPAEAAYVSGFREAFPLVANKLSPAEAEPHLVAARTVVDGLAMVRDFQEAPGATDKKADQLLAAMPDEVETASAGVVRDVAETLDAVADLLTAEGVYQAVEGNFDRSGAALEAASGNGTPPELDCVSTPVLGVTYTHRVCLLLNDVEDFGSPDEERADPRGLAEPRVAAWCRAALGAFSEIGVGFDFVEEETAPTQLNLVDVNRASLDELEGLPGINRSLAEAIVAERESERGRFVTLQRLVRVDGLGADDVERLEPFASVRETKRLNLNTATIAELKRLPSVSSAMARSVIASKPPGGYRRVDELLWVGGVGTAAVNTIRAAVTTGYRERVDINAATAAELQVKLGVHSALADALVDARGGSPFRRVDDLLQVAGVGAGSMEALSPHVTTLLVDLNRAPAAQLRDVPRIGDQLAQRILEHRKVSTFESVDDLLQVEGFTPSVVDDVRPFVSTSQGEVSLDELGLSPSDLLYAAQSLPEGGATELEQRVANRVRTLYGLGQSQQVSVLALRRDGRSRSLADVTEVARRIFASLADGRPVSPASLRHAAAEEEDYGSADVAAFRERAWSTYARGLELLAATDAAYGTIEADVRISGEVGTVVTEQTVFLERTTASEWRGTANKTITSEGVVLRLRNERPAPALPQSVGTQWELKEPSEPVRQIELEARVDVDAAATVVELLDRLSRWGIPGALSDGPDDPYLSHRLDNARAELTKRLDTWSRRMPPVDVNTASFGVLARVLGHAVARTVLFVRARAPITGPEHLEGLSDETVDRLVDASGTVGGLNNATLEELAVAAATPLAEAIVAARADGNIEELVGLGLDLSAVRPQLSTGSEAPEGEVAALRSAIKAILGESFVVLPEIVPGSADDLASSLASDLLGGAGVGRIEQWVEQTAEVRPAVATLEDSLHAVEAWTESDRGFAKPAFALSVAQVPHADSRSWVALGDGEKVGEPPVGDPARETWPRSPLSLVLASFGDMPQFDPPAGDASRVVTAGVLVDEFSELKPDREVPTSIAFQYDAPGAQAPQALLLAVPSRIEDSPGPWTLRELAEIVTDTMDLAKVRAVDPDALSARSPTLENPSSEPVGVVSPAIYMPTDPDRPGADRGPGLDLIEFFGGRSSRVLHMHEVRATGSGGSDVRREVFVRSKRGDLRPGSRVENEGTDASLVLGGAGGLELELANAGIRVDLTVGWRQPGDVGLRLEHADGTTRMVDAAAKDLGGWNVKFAGQPAEPFAAFRFTLFPFAAKFVRLSGNCILNRVEFFE